MPRKSVPELRLVGYLLKIAETLHERDVAPRSLIEHIDTATAAGKMRYSVLGAGRAVRA